MTLLEIKKSVLGKLKEHFPTYQAYEDIQAQGFDRPAFFIQVLPISTTMEDKYHQSKLIKIDIRYFSKSETMEENLKIVEKLQQIFHTVLLVQDRKFTIQESKVNMIDKVLDFSFQVYFMDMIQAYDYQVYEEMQNLNMKEEI
ncbi:phage tail terminator family protein [Marinisporobacter balticus]|uniref:Phage protein n=1 Tax=Marinisporobacter balticus TaxID=2018667 RepID=A0A4R2KW00_9FIRM|nr:hypothetical protein [Marinisporobacter balticus]TCO78023.1 hypothetical protein EV214_105122 [Marinisporobacter balticus]